MRKNYTGDKAMSEQTDITPRLKIINAVHCPKSGALVSTDECKECTYWHGKVREVIGHNNWLLVCSFK